MEKKCARCKEMLPISEFSKRKQLKDGLESKCRTCDKKLRQESRAKYEAMVRPTEKKCTRCKEVLPASEYNRKRRLRDGLDIYCRECARVLRKESAERLKQEGAVRRVTKRDYSRPPGYFTEYTKLYNFRHPERVGATWKVRGAIKSGKISPIETQSCSVCGVAAQEYHHMDYSKPLEVVPMCRSCHRMWHYENKALE